MKSARDFLRYFEEDPGILSLQEFELPTEDEWRSRFMLLNFKHKTDPVLRGAPPLRMFDVKSRDGKSLLNLKSFISFFSTSIILIRYGPKEKLKPIQRFNLYHEMAHCSIPGIIIWGKLFGMPFSALVSGLILTGLCPSPFFWWVLGASVVYVAISTSFWLYEGNSGMIEIFADGYAMKRLVEEDLDVAETAGNYWLKLWTKELASGSSRWVELKARISEMKYSLRKIDRWKQDKLVVFPIREDPSRTMIMVDYLFLGLAIYLALKIKTIDYDMIGCLIVCCLVLAYIGHRFIRDVSACHAQFK